MTVQAYETDYPRFHYAFPVRDLAEARNFYGKILGCSEGRSNDQWIDFNFFGHQVVAHLDPQADIAVNTSKVDHCTVPKRHFGVILPWETWHNFADTLKAKQIQFIIEPQTRFKGKIGEQATMFFCDPCGNALEFKAFKDPSRVFAKGEDERYE